MSNVLIIALCLAVMLSTHKGVNRKACFQSLNRKFMKQNFSH